MTAAHANPASLSSDDVRAAAARLLETDVTAARPAERQGRNNRLFRVDTATGPVALKVYARAADDPRDRLATEFGALAHLTGAGVDAVPAPLARDPDAGIGAYGWIDGAPVGTVGDAEIDDALDFLAAIDATRAAGGHLPEASEACLSAAVLARQNAARFKALRDAAAAHPGTEHGALARWLEGALDPALAAWTEAAQAAYQAAGLSWDAPIAEGERCLSPSDFGFHNALRAEGRIVYVDFEYFGWDDPVKLAADFILHPGMAQTAATRRRFLSGAGRLFGRAGSGFSDRLGALFPLYGLRWCAIVLNTFLPGRDGSDDVQRAQRLKAEALLATLASPETALEAYVGGRPPT